MPNKIAGDRNSDGRGAFSVRSYEPYVFHLLFGVKRMNREIQRINPVGLYNF
ncbi:hypothetical protein [Chroococcidiopsis thermalis]|uniref:hypothetical protein n=1 Tax=Chroococcidiopsis thermalis TaxID=54299 RepID=UPI0002F2C8EE|nr:hypothetical protein [Chroococcidiopsis thermalis]